MRYLTQTVPHCNHLYTGGSAIDLDLDSSLDIETAAYLVLDNYLDNPWKLTRYLPNAEVSDGTTQNHVSIARYLDPGVNSNIKGAAQ